VPTALARRARDRLGQAVLATHASCARIIEAVGRPRHRALVRVHGAQHRRDRARVAQRVKPRAANQEWHAWRRQRRIPPKRPQRADVARGRRKGPDGRRVEEDEAAHELGALERELHGDVATKAVPHKNCWPTVEHGVKERLKLLAPKVRVVPEATLGLIVDGPALALAEPVERVRLALDAELLKLRGEMKRAHAESRQAHERRGVATAGAARRGARRRTFARAHAVRRRRDLRRRASVVNAQPGPPRPINGRVPNHCRARRDWHQAADAQDKPLVVRAPRRARHRPCSYVLML